MPLEKKLSCHQVRAIRRSDRSTHIEAVEYDVSPKAIRNIRQGITYKDVPDRPRITEDIRRGFNGKYETGDVVRLLEEVPDEYAQTILTMPRQLGAGRGEHVHRERRIIEECLRIAGDFGVVIYVHRPRLGDDGVVDLGADILEGRPLRQALTWTWPAWREVPADPTGRGLRLRQNYAHIYIFSGQFWMVPEGNYGAGRRRLSSSVLSIPPPHPANAPPGFPLELARRCIALGRGRVLDPHAGTGTTALAAKEADRIWTLFDDTDTHRGVFEERMAGKGSLDQPSRSAFLQARQSTGRDRS